MFDANGGDPVRVNRVVYEPDRVVVVIGADTIVRRGKCCLDAIISPVAIAMPRSDRPVVFRDMGTSDWVQAVDWRDSINAVDRLRKHP